VFRSAIIELHEAAQLAYSLVANPTAAIPESLSTNIVSLSEKPDQRRLSPHDSKSVSRGSDGASLRFPALPAWSRTVVVLLTAAMSGCRGTDLIGTDKGGALVRLASPVTVRTWEAAVSVGR
jgi:hypothetical protein